MKVACKQCVWHVAALQFSFCGRALTFVMFIQFADQRAARTNYVYAPRQRLSSVLRHGEANLSLKHNEINFPSRERENENWKLIQSRWKMNQQIEDSWRRINNHSPHFSHRCRRRRRGVIAAAASDIKHLQKNKIDECAFDADVCISYTVTKWKFIFIFISHTHTYVFLLLRFFACFLLLLNPG